MHPVNFEELLIKFGSYIATFKINHMSKEIKDYLHLYLGCEVIDFTINKNGNKFIFDANNFPYVLSLISENKGKLLLRSLPDMTEKEAVELEMMGHELVIKRVESNQFHGERTKRLLSMGFDLLNLIPEGLAINKLKP